MTWQSYLKCVKGNNKYYCKKCVKSLYSVKTKIKNMINNNKSFGYWLIKNLSLKDAISIIVRWDENLNQCDIRDVSYGSYKKYWLKCSRKLHDSKLQSIKSFTSGYKSNLDCHQCNSIAQWGIDNLDKNFLEKYWSEKNNALGLDPWKTSYASAKKVWIKCQEKDYHENYKVRCSDFVNNNSRCPYCRGLKVHPKDSLGQNIMDNYGEEFLDRIWSKNNNKSSFEYSPFSQQKVWWKCSDGKHKDYYRNIDNSNIMKFRCPECQYSKGEKKIEEYLINNNFKKDIDYTPQKEFDGLVGLKDGNLSYEKEFKNTTRT